MKEITFTTEELKNLRRSARNLSRANRAVNYAKKIQENAKKFITVTLSNKGVDLDDLKAKESIEIDGLLNIYRDIRQAFDQAEFAAKHPKLYAEFYKEGLCTYFKPLVCVPKRQTKRKMISEGDIKEVKEKLKEVEV